MAKRTRGTPRTTNTGTRSGSSLGQLARERPLLVVGAGVLLGMTLGALLPWSRIEDELLGEQAEKLKDSARELASDGFEKMKSVVQPAYESVTEAIRGSAGSGGSDNSSTTRGQPVQTKINGTDTPRL